MGFIQPCYIRKNTSYLIKKLEELGYISHIFNNNDANNIYVDKLGTYISVDIENHPSYIDCETNEELFLALAALRNDTNENQWFIAQRTMWDENYNGEITVYYEENEWLMWDYYSFMEDMSSDFRKATKEEIIEHFKDR